MFSALLTIGSPYATLSLSDALALGGGGIEALLRHGISAVLGATSPYVAYPLAAADVIAQVNAAILSGNATNIENLKNTLASYNALEADLDANGNIPAPSVSITSASLTEGNSGLTPTALTVTLSGPARAPSRSTGRRSPGRRTAGSDYVAASGTVSFAPGGPMTISIPLSVVGDTVFEPERDLQRAAVEPGERDASGGHRDRDDPERRHGPAGGFDLERVGDRGQQRHHDGDVHGHALRGADEHGHGRVEHRRRHGDRRLGRLRRGVRDRHVPRRVRRRRRSA